jgi:hypothetical protein
VKIIVRDVAKQNEIKNTISLATKMATIERIAGG